MRQDLQMSTVQIVKGWLLRKKPRTDGLPISITSSALSTIQAQACFNAGKTGCAYWAARAPHSIPESEDSYYPEGHSLPITEQEDEAVKQTDTPCKACQSPGVPRAELYKGLVPDDGKDQDEQQRVLRRFMHGDGSMHPEVFMKMLANAWVAGWLSDTQVVTLIHQCIQLRGCSSVLKGWRKKLLRRKKQDEGDTGLRDLILDEIEGEEQKQWAEFFSLSDRMLKTNHRLPAPLKQELLEALRE